MIDTAFLRRVLLIKAPFKASFFRVVGCSK
jgi:hypothetical protein